MQKKWELPASVVAVVKALCVDYDRRTQIIKQVSSGLVVAKCVEINSVIDHALEKVDVGIRKTLLEDIKNGRGYRLSPISTYLAKNTYYKYKQRVICTIAEELRLVPKK